MYRNERYFGKNDGKHNFYGELDNLDQIIDKYSAQGIEEREETEAKEIED